MAKRKSRSKVRARKARPNARSRAAKKGWRTRRRNQRKAAALPPPTQPIPASPAIPADNEIHTVEGARHVKGHNLEWYCKAFSSLADFEDIQIHYEQMERPGEIFAWHLMLINANAVTQDEALVPWSTPFSTDRADITREAMEFAETVLEGGLERYKQVTSINLICFGVGYASR